MAVDTVIHHLCHKIFVGSADGRSLLKLMKEWHTNTPTFPMEPVKLERHGGAMGWAAFRAGQLDFLLRIESMANEYEQKVLADSKMLDDKK